MAGWRQGMMAWAAAAFSGFLAHPWVRDTMVGRRVVGPNEARWMEAALKTLSETRLTGGERLDLLAVVAGHVRSIAQQAAAQSGGTSTERDMTWSLDTTLIGRDGFRNWRAPLLRPAIKMRKIMRLISACAASSTASNAECHRNKYGPRTGEPDEL